MRAWVIALLVILLMAGCKEHPAAEAVRGYNLALVQAYRENNSISLDHWATERERNKVLVLVDLKKANRLVLECDQPEVTILKVEEVNPEMVLVESDELWSYQDRPLDPGVPPKPHFKVRMHMRWEVVKEGKKYKVDKGATLASEYLEPKEGIPESAHTAARPSTEANGVTP